MWRSRAIFQGLRACFGSCPSLPGGRIGRRLLQSSCDPPLRALGDAWGKRKIKPVELVGSGKKHFGASLLTATGPAEHLNQLREETSYLHVRARILREYALTRWISLVFGLVLLCFDVDDRFGNSRERLVGVLFFPQRGFEELDRLVVTKLFRPVAKVP